MRYRVGYIDDKPTQVTKYERDLRGYFDVIGYNITKGMSLQKLLTQVYESNIDLLMVDYLMKNKGLLTYNGDKVAREYEKIKPRFPILIFTQEHDDAFDAVDNPNIIYEKGDVNKDQAHFAEVVIKNIEAYRDYISIRKKTINSLSDKAEKKRLTADEKHQLLEAQQELNSLDKWQTEIPLQLLDDNKVEELERTTQQAKKFLNKLLKKKK